MFIINIGEFKNNKLCGQGSKTTKDGTVSVGMFEDGLRNGLGTENSKLTFYEGEFNNDKKHGKGKMIFKSLEEIYEGDFIDDKITGTGKKTWKNKDSYEGNFEDNQMHGKGIYFWSDGSRYEGDYIYNVKEGLGKFYWPNGNIFEGEFSNGLPNGKGIFNNRGVRYHCEFTDGRMTKKGSMIK